MIMTTNVDEHYVVNCNGVDKQNDDIGTIRKSSKDSCYSGSNSVSSSSTLPLTCAILEYQTEQRNATRGPRGRNENEEEVDDENVFQHHRSSEVITKRPAEFSPETPRKRMSTSAADVIETEFHFQEQQTNITRTGKKKPPNYLNLTTLRKSLDIPSPINCSKSGMFLEVPSIRDMHISDESSLYRSESMRCYRKPFLNDRSPTTPMIRRRDDSPTGTLRKKMRVSNTSPTNLHRAASVRVTPQYFRMQSEGATSNSSNSVCGAISSHHNQQLLNRTYSGYFKRAPSSCSLAPPGSNLKRQGSFRVVSSKVNKVKRCYSTASVIKRKDKVRIYSSQNHVV